MNQQLWFEVQAMHKAWTDLHMDRFLSKHQQVKEEAMKVQAKSPCSSPMYVVVEESPNYYIAKDSNGFLINLHKSEYEPVREWVPIYTFEWCGMKGKEIRAVHSGNGFITVEVKR